MPTERVGGAAEKKSFSLLADEGRRAFMQTSCSDVGTRELARIKRRSSTIIIIAGAAHIPGVHWREMGGGGGGAGLQNW
jgi:hypothetical protein